MGHDGADPAPAPRRPPGGPAKGDRRRQAIVDAVERLLRERTIAQLSVENIAAEAGISRSGFYFYFESKYAALGEALAEAADEINAAGTDFYTSAEEPEVFFGRALESAVESWTYHGNLMVAIVDAAHSDAGARALWDEWIESFVAGVANRIEAGRESGEIAPGPPSADLARVLMRMNASVITDLCRRHATPEQRADTVRALTHVWLTSLWGIRATT